MSAMAVERAAEEVIGEGLWGEGLLKEGGGGGGWVGGVAETQLGEGLWRGEVEERCGAFRVGNGTGVRKAGAIVLVRE